VRECPRCGHECLYTSAEGLEVEHSVMKDLSMKLTSVSKTDDPSALDEAKETLKKLRKINRRWNIPELDDFLNKRQKELFF
jgi:hypothetical protein